VSGERQVRRWSWVEAADGSQVLCYLDADGKPEAVADVDREMDVRGIHTPLVHADRNAQPIEDQIAGMWPAS
jgi:hypothetical protein